MVSSVSALLLIVATRAMLRQDVIKPRQKTRLRLRFVDFFICTFHRRTWGMIEVMMSITQERTIFESATVRSIITRVVSWSILLPLTWLVMTRSRVEKHLALGTSWYHALNGIQLRP